MAIAKDTTTQPPPPPAAAASSPGTNSSTTFTIRQGERCLWIALASLLSLSVYYLLFKSISAPMNDLAFRIEYLERLVALTTHNDNNNNLGAALSPPSLASPRVAEKGDDAAATAAAGAGATLPPPLPFPAHAFWHIGNTGVETWRVVVAEQLSRLYRSGLVDAMNVTAVYYAADEASTPDFLDPRISVEYAGEPGLYEWPTLLRLQSYCAREPQGRVVYFHSKGASKSLADKQGWNCYNWRKVMEHFTIDLHRSILLNELSDESKYAVAGIHRKHDHYSGNFWLAKCSYINKLPSIAELDEPTLHNRHEAEFWIGSKNFFDFVAVSVNCWDVQPGKCQNLYHCYYPEHEYLGIKRCRGEPEGPPSLKES